MTDTVAVAVMIVAVAVVATYESLLPLLLYPLSPVPVLPRASTASSSKCLCVNARGALVGAAVGQ